MLMRAVNPIRTLALDTSTRRGSLALLEGRGVIAEMRTCSLETHSARLLRSLSFLLSSAGWSLSEVNLVAAGIGPGSFTGIRIGLATALGLAQSLSVPFVGISGMDALARVALLPQGRLGVVTDAQRKQVYYAEYLAHGGKIKRTRGPALWYPTELRHRVRLRGLWLIGDGIERFFEGHSALRSTWPRLVETDLFTACAIGRLAVERRRHWKVGEYITAEPLYIRPPDAMRSGA